MDISAALATDLASLTDALAASGTDLEALLAGLSGRVRRAVPSCVGLSMTLVMDGFPLTLATVDEVAEVAASMLLPLSALDTTEPGDTVVFYAAHAGAFVDLAADVDFAVDDGLRLVILDEHLQPPAATSGVDGLDALSATNRAIGFLIAEGCTPDEAGDELIRRAGEAGVSRHTAALRVVLATGE